MADALTYPLEWRIVQEQEYRVIGETRLWGHKIIIAESNHKEMIHWDGLCVWARGKMYVFLAPRVVKSKDRFEQVLVHELTHAVEYLNDPDFLDPRLVEGCSLLAQAMEEAWPELRKNMKLDGQLTKQWKKRKR